VNDTQREALRLLLDSIIQLGDEWDTDDLSTDIVAFVRDNAAEVERLLGFERVTEQMEGGIEYASVR
jgi:hypothetical protein